MAKIKMVSMTIRVSPKAKKILGEYAKVNDLIPSDIVRSLIGKFFWEEAGRKSKKRDFNDFYKNPTY